MYLSLAVFCPLEHHGKFEIGFVLEGHKERYKKDGRVHKGFLMVVRREDRDMSQVRRA